MTLSADYDAQRDGGGGRVLQVTSRQCSAVSAAELVCAHVCLEEAAFPRDSSVSPTRELELPMVFCCTNMV